jgi:hypothetical protein
VPDKLLKQYSVLWACADYDQSRLASCGTSSDMVRGDHHVTRHNTPIHNILSTVPRLSISQKALGTLPEDGNIMPKHIGAIIHN